MIKKAFVIFFASFFFCGLSHADDLQAVTSAYLKGDYAAARKLSTKAGGGFARSRTNDEIRYMGALSLLKLGRFEEARYALNDIENSAVEPAMKASAAVSIADTYWLEKRLDEAAQQYRRANVEYRDFDEKPYAKARLAELEARPQETPGR